MDDHAGRVEHAPQPGCAHSGELGADARLEVTRIGAGGDLLARAREDQTRGVDGERIADRARELVDRREVA